MKTTWRWDVARQCYVEPESGITATFESLLRGRSEAEFELPPGGNMSSQNAVYLQQMAMQNAHQNALQQYNNAWQTNYGPPVALAPAVKPPAVEDEFGWLRRRVDEVCWKAA